ncbi:hypothetical protein [Neobacillus soli]|uniref:hypothetical protein n=1 Tax=Neobacillus soli TaxID=220688 RepID=UPI0008254348|nr:hypothetical protein [Neobacillus soli]
MKNFLLGLLALIVSVALFGCNKTEAGQATKSEQYKQKIIIMNSVNDPLQPEAKNVEYMPSGLGPQQIPNALLDNPIIITRMPYSDKKNSD